jgi:hypothetical protein
MTAEMAVALSILLSNTCVASCERPAGADQFALSRLPRSLYKVFSYNGIGLRERSPEFLHHRTARALSRDKHRILRHAPLQVFCKQTRLHLQHTPIGQPIVEEWMRDERVHATAGML